MPLHALKDRLKGIFVLALTPMDADLRLDLEALRRNVDHFIAAGVHGIIVGGTYAEFPSLTFTERDALFRAAGEAVAGRVPLLCCTAASGTAEAIQLSRAAQAAGADGVMVTPPYVHEVRPRDIVYHFERLSEALDLPILIYNSTSIGVHLNPELLTELGRLPGVIGAKQGATDLHDLIRSVAYAGDRMALLCGSDGLVLGALAIGMPGCTSTNANFMAAEFVALYDEIKAGESERARARFYRWQPIRDFARKYGQPATTKAALELVGLPSGPVRPPFQSLDNSARQELRAVLTRAGII